ncbi:UDP-N-acetylglucosamine transporter [Folsomia candida]|uniref:UDP-N-acetylglucosamine transporter n=1 Tax=Folsomia candida TaxID=158441 RepID=A0A226E5A0_FOLCA|nr:UDP-N-acetylglucosamine transporter [Folsomia candida]XP_021955074.1 UDP-N-acetylglucosamine transporter [Folsomia candida]OXA52478.1 UDP-N-acetylglucosamine transporter [Folsomia candida]
MDKTEHQYPLLDKSESNMQDHGSKSNHRLKYLSLVTLIVQNAALALSMRYARTRQGHMFMSSTAVLNSEIVKLFICLYAVYWESNSSVPKWIHTLRSIIINQPMDTLKVCIPSMVYVVQNNLLYVAASHLDAATYQVTYQLKILTTAIFSIIILRRKLILTQWTALLLLVVGVIMVQLAQTDEKSSSLKTEAGEQNRVVGFVAAIAACCLSGFAGIYFEKILKGSDISVWMRNVQLSLCSIPFAIITCGLNDMTAISEKGYFYGYDLFIIYVVVLQAGGGLVVAMVVKYADNILKGFATSLAIIVSCVASVIFFEFHVTLQFCLGTMVVIVSIFLYGYQPPTKGKQPSLIVKV